MANETPESDFSIECFQNYSAPEVFVQGLAGMVDQTDIEAIIRAQKTMLQRFEKTTEMLTNCNQLSASRLSSASMEFKKHAQLLLDMKKDLNYIFKKIRAIKSKLSSQYPEAYKKALASAKKLSIDDEEEAKPVESTNETRMAATVSTETLKPTSSTDKKAKEKNSKKPNQTDDNSNTAPSEDGVATVEKPQESMRRPKRNSSSSETESASSGDDISSDTG